MDALTILVLLVLAYGIGRLFQWKRDRAALRFSRNASEIVATITDIAEYRQRLQQDLGRLGKK
ncbi:hypothetical protein [Streptomyces sp. NPDC054829]